MRTIDARKLGMVVGALVQNPDGMWIRQISRETNLPVSTVHYYISLLEPILEEVRLHNIMRVVRIKSDVIRRLREGESLGEILRRVRLLRDAVNF